MTPEDPDATRIHLAAHDPAFPALRERAFAQLAEDVGAALAPLGFDRKGHGWAVHGPAGRGVVHLGRDRYGWAAVITLRWCAAGADEDEEVQLQDLGEGPLRLVYADLAVDPELTAKMRSTLLRPGIGWLRAQGAQVGG